MDMFITVVLWVVGFFAFGILGLAFAFSAGGAAQTGKTELKVISSVSFLLIVFLIGMAVYSVFSSIAGSFSDVNTSIDNGNALVSGDFMIWSFYAVFFMIFFLWLFTPSKNKGSEKNSIKNKIIGSMTLKKDESGLQAWDQNWKPEKDKESDT